MAGMDLVTGDEAAAILGIAFTRFKVAIYRGLGKDKTRKPSGNEPQPVQGGWSARSAKYRAKDILRMHNEYHFRTARNFTPDYEWLRSIPKVNLVPIMARVAEPKVSRAAEPKIHAPTPITSASKRQPPKPVREAPATAMPMAARTKTAPKATAPKKTPPKPTRARQSPPPAEFRIVDIANLFSL